MPEITEYDRYFLSYSGIKLPLKLVSEIGKGEIENRNTFLGACFDEAGNTTLIHKRVYGELELEHRYTYDEDGNLKTADIVDADGEENRLEF